MGGKYGLSEGAQLWPADAKPRGYFRRVALRGGSESGVLHPQPIGWTERPRFAAIDRIAVHGESC